MAGRRTREGGKTFEQVTAAVENPPAGKPPAKVILQGLRRTAEAIARHFKTTCSKDDISYFKSLEPPFPAPSPGTNFYQQEEVFAWFETNIMPKRRAKLDGQDFHSKAAKAKASTVILANKEAQFDFDVKQGKYISRSVAKRSIVGFAKRFKSWVFNELEKKLPDARREKLRQLGAGPEIIAAFYEFDLAQSVETVGNIEQRGETFAKEAQDALEN